MRQLKHGDLITELENALSPTAFMMLSAIVTVVIMDRSFRTKQVKRNPQKQEGRKRQTHYQNVKPLVFIVETNTKPSPNPSQSKIDFYQNSLYLSSY